MNEFSMLCTVGAAVGSILAAARGICPDPDNPKCNPIRGKIGWASVTGLLSFAFYYLIFIGFKGTIECCHYLAFLATAYLFGHIVYLYRGK